VARRRAGGAEHYVALLRGINVGGNNVIRMLDLRTCFEAQKLSCVETYIASGNVLFEATDADAAALTSRIERALSKTFGYESRVVLRSARQMSDTLAKAPPGFGRTPTKFRYDVLFLKEPLSAEEALVGLKVKEGVDEVSAGPGALYFTRLIARASQSGLTRIVALPVYKSLTIRNWNTTTKLAALLSARPARAE
jgi:uncharacterized protein (DUF1697 family)